MKPLETFGQLVNVANDRKRFRSGRQWKRLGGEGKLEYVRKHSGTEKSKTD